MTADAPDAMTATPAVTDTPRAATDGAISFPWTAPPAEGEAIAVADGVLWMRLPLPMRLDHVNIYALDDDDGWTIIDTGFDTAHARAVWDRLLAGPLAGKPVAQVLATHHHADHIGLAGWLMERGARLLTSRTAWLMARMLYLDVQDHPTPEQVQFWRRAGMDADRIASRMAERPWNAADVAHPLPLGYTRLCDGQTVTMGRRRWRIAEGNGHAPEHLTLWSLDDDLVIGGDQLLPGISPNLGVHATEPDASPVEDWLESCARLALLAEDRHLVLPGHKLPFRGLPQRLAQLHENHESALSRLASSLAERPRTAVDSFDVLFRRKIGEGEFGLALVEAQAHVNALLNRGQIRAAGETPDGGVIWGAADTVEAAKG